MLDSDPYQIIAQNSSIGTMHDLNTEFEQIQYSQYTLAMYLSYIAGEVAHLMHHYSLYCHIMHSRRFVTFHAISSN